MMVLLQGMEGEFPYLLQAARASGVQEAKWMPQQGSPTLNNNKNKDWNLFFMIENLKWVKLLFQFLNPGDSDSLHPFPNVSITCGR